MFRERELPQRVSDRALFVSAACVVDMLHSFNITPVLYVVCCTTPLSLICCMLYHSCVVDTLPVQQCSSSYDPYVMDTVFAADTGVVHCTAVHTVLIRKWSIMSKF